MIVNLLLWLLIWQQLANRDVLICRNLLMRGFHLLVMMVIGDKVKDTQCGFKVQF